MAKGDGPSESVMLVSEEVAALRADLETMKREKEATQADWLECSWKRKLVTRKIGNMG